LNKDTRNAQINAGKGVRTGKADNIDLVFQFIQKHYKVETVIDGDTIYRLIKPYKP
jgi:isopropylmalate/homocitrate/citramalate synthase